MHPGLFYKMNIKYLASELPFSFYVDFFMDCKFSSTYSFENGIFLEITEKWLQKN